jgi:glucose/arabinose dehydrogenase
VLFFGIVVLAAVGCSEAADCCGPPLPGALAVEVVATGLNSPLALTAPDGDSRQFVVEQSGRIRIVRDTLLTQPFLDISGIVQSGGERGLLGLAFHPSYAANGFFYVNHTDSNGDTRVVRYSVSGDPDVADPASASTILQVAQPFGNHNGGSLVFGPDGMLYIGLGDGGNGGDPLGHGQDSTTLLGSILRIDVDGASPYAIPSDNPFAGHASARPEIWAYGLRNPWRFSFDEVADQVYIGDVGQGQWEEIDVVARITPNAYNFGWNPTEGAHCFLSPGCDMSGFTLPVFEYDHNEGCSVAGGHVYRGSAISGLQGTYFYSDFCAGWLRSFRLSGGAATEPQEWDVAIAGQILSLGEDANGELYVLSDNGTVYRLVSGS